MAAVSTHDLADVLAPERQAQWRDDIPAAGIDIGSRQSKAVLAAGGRLHTAITASGVDSQETAERLVARLLRAAGIDRERLAAVVGTGYGRIALQLSGVSTRVVTEITCHALGAHHLNAGTRTLVDVGGQDCKAIKIDPTTGNVVEFAMNDKCAAGTGRFLEKTAEMLGFTLEELGDRALDARKRLEMSSQCVVFAESEIVSLKARGERGEDIAAAVHFAAARRVKNLVGRVGLDPEVVFSGGVSNNRGMRAALEEVLKHPLKPTRLDTTYCGALGALALARRLARDPWALNAIGGAR